MNHLELVDKYALPEFPVEPEHALILININKLDDRSDRKAIYNLVRYFWRISAHIQGRSRRVPPRHPSRTYPTRAGNRQAEIDSHLEAGRLHNRSGVEDIM